MSTPRHVTGLKPLAKAKGYLLALALLVDSIFFSLSFHTLRLFQGH
jgi:hypothetical protein